MTKLPQYSEILHQQNFLQKLYSKQPLTTDMDEKGGSDSPLISITLDLAENS